MYRSNWMMTHRLLIPVVEGGARHCQFTNERRFKPLPACLPPQIRVVVLQQRAMDDLASATHYQTLDNSCNFIQ